MAVSVYPLAALVVIVISCAAMLLILVLVALGVFASTPKLTSVAVGVMPAFVVSVAVQPVVLPELTADPLLTPEIENERVASTVARTSTVSIVPIATVASSRIMPLLSLVLIFIFQISAVPAVADLVGLMIRGA